MGILLGGNVTAEQLVQEALVARENAYAPYSRYQVGAALCTKEGKIYHGCNIENASYGATNCAERTAFFKAVSEGERDFAAIAIVGGMAGKEPVDYAYPCGICRQVMQEFGGEDLVVIVAKSEKDYLEWRLQQLFPFGFSTEQMK